MVVPHEKRVWTVTAQAARRSSKLMLPRTNCMINSFGFHGVISSNSFLCIKIVIFIGLIQFHIVYVYV